MFLVPFIAGLVMCALMAFSVPWQIHWSLARDDFAAEARTVLRHARTSKVHDGRYRSIGGVEINETYAGANGSVWFESAANGLGFKELWIAYIPAGPPHRGARWSQSEGAVRDVDTLGRDWYVVTFDVSFD